MRRLKSMTATMIIATATAAMVATPSAAQDNNNQDQQEQTQQGQSRGRQAQAQQDVQEQREQGQQARRGQAQQAQGQQQTAGRSQRQQAEQQDKERERRKLQVFELEHRDPQQLLQLINLWDEVSASPGFGVAQGFPQQAARQAQQQKEQQKTKVVIATDPEKKMLFARGTDEQLDEIQSLIDAVDVEDDQLEAHEYAGHKLIPIETGSANQVQTTLNQLELAGRMISLGPVNFITYRVDEDEDKLEQAEEVISKLASRNREARQARGQSGSGQRDGGQRDGGQRDGGQRGGGQRGGDGNNRNAQND